MTAHRIRRLLLAAAVVATAAVASASPTAAQQSPVPTELGTAISIPTPDEHKLDTRNYNTAELNGAAPAIGSQLIDGRLPRPLLDYGSASSGSLQRISFFEGGLVVVHVQAGGARLRKRVVFPAGAIDVYLEMLSPEQMKMLATSDMGLAISKDTGFIRRYLPEGTPVGIEFSNSRVLPAEVQRLRTVLDDLVRILAEDREVTNPMIVYKPRLGDKLIGEDQKLYKVTAIKNEGTLLELTSTKEPITIFVATKDVFTHFHAVLGRDVH
ncbi:MAG: hypothetical protein HYU52_06715 [Acidobacteria bacterium]|nr:hypothetical protein [Acidobacteriota bacterium]